MFVCLCVRGCVCLCLSIVCIFIVCVCARVCLSIVCICIVCVCVCVMCVLGCVCVYERVGYDVKSTQCIPWYLRTCTIYRNSLFSVVVCNGGQLRASAFRVKFNPTEGSYNTVSVERRRRPQTIYHTASHYLQNRLFLTANTRLPSSDRW